MVTLVSFFWEVIPDHECIVFALHPKSSAATPVKAQILNLRTLEYLWLRISINKLFPVPPGPDINTFKPLSQSSNALICSADNSNPSGIYGHVFKIYLGIG